MKEVGRYVCLATQILCHILVDHACREAEPTGQHKTTNYCYQYSTLSRILLVKRELTKILSEGLDCTLYKYHVLIGCLNSRWQDVTLIGFRDNGG